MFKSIVLIALSLTLGSAVTAGVQAIEGNSPVEQVGTEESFEYTEAKHAEGHHLRFRKGSRDVPVPKRKVKQVDYTVATKKAKKIKPKSVIIPRGPAPTFPFPTAGSGTR